MPTVQQEPCDICGGTILAPCIQVSLCCVIDKWIYRCQSCGFRQVRPRLTNHELDQLYPSDYFDTTASIGYVDYAREAQRRAREAYFLARHLRKKGVSLRVLEVGCALGFFLSALRDEGIEVQGVDTSSFAAYFAKTRFGLSIHQGTLEDANFPSDSFDFVVQKDLLEHVLNPRQHLLDTYRVMRPGARLCLVTPNGEANLRPLIALQRKNFSESNDLPLLDQGHISFFSPIHLRRLFRETGFVIERSRTIGIRRGFRALGFLPGQRRFSRLVPRMSISGGVKFQPTMTNDDQFLKQALKIEKEIAKHHSWIRCWIPYAYLHKLLKQFDSFPVASSLGYDFEFLLRKE